MLQRPWLGAPTNVVFHFFTIVDGLRSVPIAELWYAFGKVQLWRELRARLQRWAKL
ncbi:hypothetical protein BDV11DRAFT_190792 [Aspergillus similis]